MTKRILVIDDEELVLKTMNRLLKKAGYDVILVQNGAEAIEKVKESSFDLIICDIRMPGTNGIETIKEIRSILHSRGDKKIPEFFITGYASEEALKQAESLQVAEYIYKPFDTRQFLELIERQLGK